MQKEKTERRVEPTTWLAKVKSTPCGGASAPPRVTPRPQPKRARGGKVCSSTANFTESIPSKSKIWSKKSLGEKGIVCPQGQSVCKYSLSTTYARCLLLWYRRYLATYNRIRTQARILLYSYLGSDFVITLVEHHSTKLWLPNIGPIRTLVCVNVICCSTTCINYFYTKKGCM